MHDTFFLKNPAECNSVPAGYVDRVKETHEHGYEYPWQIDEAKKNLLRTHTTAISS